MKKLTTTLLALTTLIQFTACKSEQKKETPTVEKTIEIAAPFSLKTAQNTINWTAYKTTDKVPVKGVFKSVDITNGGEGKTAKEAINNTEFSIPVSSIFTNNETRDFKLRKFFFGAMTNTSLLAGKFHLENDSIGNADITMNGITAQLPFTYTITNKVFNLNATLDLNKWSGNAAIDSLNVVCREKHTAADGVSKTWTDVAINVSSTFK